MTFSIKSIDKKILDEIYTPEIAAEFERHIYPKRNWDSNVESRTWAVDESVNAYFFEVVLADRMDASVCYAFITEDKYALIKTVAYCQYMMIQASEGVKSDFDRVKHLIADALRVGGRYLNGTTDPNDTFSVPNAQFLEI